MPGPMPSGLTPYQESRWPKWSLEVKDRVRVALQLRGLNRRKRKLEKALAEVRKELAEAEEAFRGKGTN